MVRRRPTQVDATHQAPANSVDYDEDLTHETVSSLFPHGLVLYAHEESIWKALTGHKPDPTKVPAKQLQLLSIIASCGPQGIGQPQLIKRSGQDKRSVPHRTDKLHDNGYILKSGIVDSGRHILTSHCLLRKYVNTEVPNTIPWNTLQPPEARQKLFNNQATIDLPLFLDFVMHISKDRDFVPADELRMRLDIKSKQWHRSLFLRILRKMHVIGIIEMGRMPVQKETGEKLVPSIQFIREPTEQEKGKFGRLHQYEKVAEDDEAVTNNVEDEDDDSFDAVGQTTPFAHHAGSGSWQYDPLIQNQIFEHIHEAGPLGLASGACHERMGWQFYKKPFEIISGRLTDWRLTQPSYLQHLGTVKDVTISGKNRQYTFRSVPNMEASVSQGEASWDAVGGPPRVDVAFNERLDAWGFPHVDRKALIHSNSAPNASSPVRVHNSLQSDQNFSTPKGKGRPLKRKQDSQTPQSTIAASETPAGTTSTKKRKISTTSSLSLAARHAPGATSLHLGSLAPGVHIDPPGRGRPRRQGRPPKYTKIMVVKSEQLRTFAWFKTIPSRWNNDPTVDTLLPTQGILRSTASTGISGGPMLFPFNKWKSQTKRPGTGQNFALSDLVTPLQGYEHPATSTPATRAVNGAFQGSSDDDSRQSTEPLTLARARARTAWDHHEVSERNASPAQAEAMQTEEDTALTTAITGEAQTASTGQALRLPADNAARYEDRTCEPSLGPSEVDKVVQVDRESLQIDRHPPGTNRDNDSQVDTEAGLAFAPQRSHSNAYPSTNISAESLSPAVGGASATIHRPTPPDNPGYTYGDQRAGVSAHTAQTPTTLERPIDDSQSSAMSADGHNGHFANDNLDEALASQELWAQALGDKRQRNRGQSHMERETYSAEANNNSEIDQHNLSTTPRAARPEAPFTPLQYDDSSARVIDKPAAPTGAKHTAMETATAIPPMAQIKDIIKTGGQVSFERASLLIHITTQSGGVYPATKEVWYAFASALRSSKGRKTPVPDPTTIYRLVDNLSDAGTLRKIIFHHQTFSGGSIKLKIVMLGDVSEDDPRVERLKAEMRAHYPGAYFPPAFPIEPEIRAKAGRRLGAERGETRQQPYNVMWNKVLQPKADREATAAPNGTEPAWMRWYKEHMVEGEQRVEEPDIEHSANKRKMGLLAPAPKRRRLSQASDPDATSRPLSLLDRKAAKEARFDMTYAMRALLDPCLVGHEPSGTYGTIYEVRIRRRPIGRRHINMRIDTAAPAQYEAQMPQDVDDMITVGSEDGPSNSNGLGDFAHSIDQVAQWEITNAQLFTQNKSLARPRFINHVGETTGPSLDFTALNFQETWVADVADAQPGAVFDGGNAARATPASHEVQESLSGSRSGMGTRSRGKYTRLRRPLQTQGPPLIEESPAPARTPDLPQSSTQAGHDSFHETPGLRQAPHATAQKQTLPDQGGSVPRGPGPLSIWTESEIERMIAVVTAIRVLTGGKIKSIDWNLVNRYIAFSLHGHTSPAAWRKITLSRKGQIQALEYPFPQAYLQAYEQQEVPSVNYDDLATTDWESIFSWAAALIGDWRDAIRDKTPLESSQDNGQSHLATTKLLKKSELPASRQVLVSRFECEVVDSAFQPDDLFDPKAPAAKLRTAQVDCPFQLAVRPKAVRKGREVIDPVDERTRLRSHLRAEANSQSQVESRRAAFGNVSEERLREAIHGLEVDGAIEVPKKSTSYTFRAPDHLNVLLRKSITFGNSERFQRAMQYKRELDTAFDGQQSSILASRFSYFADDGEVLALMNLVAAGKVRISLDVPPTLTAGADQPDDITTKPDDITTADSSTETLYPKTLPLFGSQLTSTRSAKVDPSGLIFELVVQPTSSFETGIPPIDRNAWEPPTLAAGGWKDKAIPVWCDLDGHLLHDRWYLIVVSLVCWLVSRPMSSTAAITKAWGKKSSIQAWEVELVLEYLGDRGVTKAMKGARWTLTDWWWCVLGETGWAVGKGQGKAVVNAWR